MQSKSSRISILSPQFQKIHTNHGITLSKAGSPDLRGVTFSYTKDREIDQRTLIVRFVAQKDGTIPREYITYQTPEMAKEAYDILKKFINKRNTREQRDIFNALNSQDERPAEKPVTRTVAEKRGRRRITHNIGLLRFLRADLSP